ncbi:MAG: archaetidylserine decarboxylase [Dokdonella sp.]
MRASVLLQTMLPHRFVSRLVLWATRWTWRPWKDFLIGRIVRSYHVDLTEARNADFSTYPHFNAFFTRELKVGARPQPRDGDAIACPADGRISQSGTIEAGHILQAKGHDFTCADLLDDADAAAGYSDGSFLTVYLSPRDYHRVHMPLAGELLETVHVPGRIFSVAPFAVDAIPRVFARNERLVCHFKSDFGSHFVVVLVGAMLVSGIETVWRGVEVPPYASRTTRRDYRGREIRLERGAEMGRFNMGSTVIALLPAALGRFADTLRPQQPVRVGELVGCLQMSHNVTQFDNL